MTSENFVDTSPTAPDTKGKESKIVEEDSKIPYQIHASINEPGLGLLTWWNT